MARRAYLRSVRKSTSFVTAAITTAARVASGRFANRPVRNSRVSTVSAATTMPESCDTAPAETLTAVFDRDPLTIIPEDSPAPMFAVPTPSSSRFGSIS